MEEIKKQSYKQPPDANVFFILAWSPQNATVCDWMHGVGEVVR
jgi:hypothetical protein